MQVYKVSNGKIPKNGSALLDFKACSQLWARELWLKWAASIVAEM